MELRQLRALGAAKAAYQFLVQDFPPEALGNASPGFRMQVGRLRTLIDAIETCAVAQGPSIWQNRNAARDAAVRQLRDLSLRTLRQLARVIVASPSGVTVSPEFPSLIPVPETSHVEAILQAASATAQQIAPYQALFVAWGLAPDFLAQLNAEIAQVETLAEAARDARQAQLTATRDIARLLREIRQTLRGLTSALRYFCARDGAQGAVTYATWRQIKRPRRASSRTTEQTEGLLTSLVQIIEEIPVETTAARPQIPPASRTADVPVPVEMPPSASTGLRLIPELKPRPNPRLVWMSVIGGARSLLPVSAPYHISLRWYPPSNERTCDALSTRHLVQRSP